jgi:hypothetical protein
LVEHVEQSPMRVVRGREFVVPARLVKSAGGALQAPVGLLVGKLDRLRVEGGEEAPEGVALADRGAGVTQAVAEPQIPIYAVEPTQEIVAKDRDLLGR